MYQVECGKTQYYGFLESCEEHTHKADRREVRDATFTFFVLIYGNAKLVPSVFFGFAIACLLACYTFVYNVVLPYLHRIFSNAHAVLVIFFVFVEREVLVNILHVGLCFIGCAVFLG